MSGNAGQRPRAGQFSRGAEGPGLREVLVVAALFSAIAAAIFATYARIPPEDLYSVDRDGVAGGLSRVLMGVNWPGALIAIAVLPLVVERLRRPLAGVPGLALCGLIVVPGVVDQHDLDAKWINALPAIGVLYVAALVAWAVRGGLGPAGRSHGDSLRVAIAVGLGVVSIPWVFAEAGFYASDVPGLGSLFRSSEVYEGAASVHYGEHHGFVGYQLVLVALLLSRQLPRMASSRLREAFAFYLGGLFAYGVGNLANDFWTEQIVKRGWAAEVLPDVTRPAANWLWAVVLALAIALYSGVWRRGRLG